MPEYKITWKIELDADSPRQAAKVALDVQRDPDSTALVFTVDTNGRRTVIDLMVADE